jgi:hypothetical protein
MSEYNLAGTSPVQFTAGGTIGQYLAVKMDGTTAKQVVVSAAEGDTTVGASMTSAVATEKVTVQIAGIAKLTASAAINSGAEVEAGSGGKIATAGGAGGNSLGVAITAAGADGDVIEVLLKVPNVKGPANS